MYAANKKIYEKSKELVEEVELYEEVIQSGTLPKPQVMQAEVDRLKVKIRQNVGYLRELSEIRNWPNERTEVEGATLRDLELIEFAKEKGIAPPPPV